MSHLLTDDDIAHMDASIEAAARGDARASAEHLDQTLQVEGSLTPYKLRELVLLADEAPAWMYSRWCVEQAYRWMLQETDPRVDEDALQTMVVSHLEELDQLHDDEVGRQELGTRVAAGDWLCFQLATYDYGGLFDFLDGKAADSLMDRCDQIHDWAEARMNGYILEETRGQALIVRDLSVGARLELVNLGALSDRGPDSPVIGRVVPASAGPGLMFESRPVSVDLQTARDVAAAATHEDPAFWITAVGDGRMEERLPRTFSWGNGTLFSSDIVPMREESASAQAEPPPGRLVELLKDGLDEHQANGVMVAEGVMIAMTVIGNDAASALAPHIAAVILEPRVFEALRGHCISAEHADFWRALAECSTGPARSRCADLARLSAA